MRIVIAEDHVLLREGLARLLTDAGHQVVRNVGTAPDLVTAVGETSPDLAVVDVRMPPGHGDDGLRAALAARQTRPELPVVVLSQYVEERYAHELLESGGGTGYLLKNRIGHVAEFLDAVGQVAAGGTVLDPQVVTQLLARRRRDDRFERLSPRERQVLELMVEGRSNQAIAEQLRTGLGAVEKHVSSVFGKLDLPPSQARNRRVQAVVAYLSR